MKLISKYLSQLQNLETANIILNDTPRNDFSVLCKTITELDGEVSDDNRLETFISMVPRSFYDQVVPTNTVDLGICTSALHWLRPGSAGIGHRHLPPKSDGEKAAQLDLKCFLAARSKEVKKDGALVLSIVGVGGHLSLIPIFECLTQVYEDLQAAGQLPPDMAAEIQGPVYFRTLEEVVDAVSIAPEWKVGQQLCQDVPLPVDHEFRNKWGDLDGAPEDAYRTYAEDVCNFLTASAANTIQAAGRKAGIENVAGLLSEVKDRFCDKFLEYGRNKPLGTRYIHVQIIRQ